MGHLSYEESKKFVFKGMWLLAFVTLVEVAISLFGKGHLGIDPSAITNLTIGGTKINILLILVGVGLIVFSLYKAYFIIYKFMHMGDEVKGLRMTVLLPMLLLVWAIIAFFWEGTAWKERRADVNYKNAIELGPDGKVIVEDMETKKMD